MLKKILNILTKKERKLFFIVLVLILFSAIFETIGIAAIIPLINLIMRDNFLVDYNYFSNFLLNVSEFLLTKDFYEANTTKNNLVIGGFVCFLLVFLIKSFFVVFLSYVQETFSKILNHSISVKLYKGVKKFPEAGTPGKNSLEDQWDVARTVAPFGILTSSTIFWVA